MAKIILERAKSRAAAASGLLVAVPAAAVGCAPGESTNPDQESVSEADLELSAGSATLGLNYQFGQPYEFLLNVEQSATDEFLRNGESLRVQIPAWLLWQELYPQTPVPNDAMRLKEMTGTVQIVFYDKILAAGTISLPLTQISGADPYDIEIATNSFIVPSKIDSLGFTINIKDKLIANASAVIASNTISPTYVFGGELPQKTLLFDSAQGVFKQRILEGANMVAGSKSLLSYSDWRADTLVDKSTIDRQIGIAQTASRFGWTQIPIYGPIVHEVSYGVYFNDSIGFRPEAPLPSTAASKLLPPGRTAFETWLQIPSKATKMSLYFHVKSYLIADYSGYTNVVQKWYADNQQILVRDKYDNPFGPFTNYDFALQN